MPRCSRLWALLIPGMPTPPSCEQLLPILHDSAQILLPCWPRLGRVPSFQSSACLYYFFPTFSVFSVHSLECEFLEGGDFILFNFISQHLSHSLLSFDLLNEWIHVPSNSVGSVVVVSCKKKKKVKLRLGEGKEWCGQLEARSGALSTLPVVSLDKIFLAFPSTVAESSQELRNTHWVRLPGSL